MRVLLFSFITIFFITACNTDKKQDQSGQLENQEIQPRGDTSTEGYIKYEPERSLPTERALAQSKLERFRSANDSPMQLLAGNTFAIDFRMVVNQEQNTEPITDERVSFKQDFSYSWEKGDSLYQQGVYYYDMHSDLLLMLSDHESDFPSEWTLKSSGNIIVLVGTSTFKNNNTQLRMVLVEEE